MPTDCPGLAELVTRLDRSVEAGDAVAITASVKSDLDQVLYAETGKALSFHA